jgi:hypothetical protein
MIELAISAQAAWHKDSNVVMKVRSMADPAGEQAWRLGTTWAGAHYICCSIPKDTRPLMSPTNQHPISAPAFPPICATWRA